MFSLQIDHHLCHSDIFLTHQKVAKLVPFGKVWRTCQRVSSPTPLDLSLRDVIYEPHRIQPSMLKPENCLKAKELCDTGGSVFSGKKAVQEPLYGSLMNSDRAAFR